MKIQNGLHIQSDRYDKGMKLKGMVKHLEGDTYHVKKYVVERFKSYTCPDNIHRNVICKHMYAVELYEECRK